MDANTNKKVVSNILLEKRKWIDVKDAVPSPGQLVVVRLLNTKIIYGETDTEIYPAEDIKVANYAKDYNNPEIGHWHIAAPYPKYDFSPLTSKDKLLDGTVVTHWAELEKGELEGWNTRFDPAFVYKKLILQVDEDHEEDVYRALMWGAAFIDKIERDNPEAKKLVRILYDLQSVLDKGEGIDRTDEEYEDALAAWEEKVVAARDKAQAESDEADTEAALNLADELSASSDKEE